MMIRDGYSIWPWLSMVRRSMAFIVATVIVAGCEGSNSDSIYNARPQSDPVSAPAIVGDQPSNNPANPAADQGAIKLLNYLNELTGKQILSGQEQLFWDNEFAPHFPSSREQYIFDRVGQYPAVYSTDFGDFHNETDPVLRADVVARRGEVVDAVIAHAQRGSIIQLHYHMVEPTEPDGTGLRRYTDGAYNSEYIDQILVKGSPLNQEYEQRLDEIAGYLARLRDEGIAVLWRPFHEIDNRVFRNSGNISGATLPKYMT